MKRVVPRVAHFIFIWTIVFVFFLLKTLPETFEKQRQIVVIRNRELNANEKTINERQEIINRRRKTFRNSFEDHRNTLQHTEPFHKFQGNLVNSRSPSLSKNEERTKLLMSKIRKNNEEPWFRNFHPKSEDAGYFLYANQDLLEINVDYLVTESGQVEPVLNDTKLLTNLTGQNKTINESYTAELIKSLRLRRKENEKHYYTPRLFKVNPIDHGFNIDGSQICDKENEYMTLLIVVPSIPSHSNVRNAIRKTYGSYSNRSLVNDHINVKVKVKLMFLLGKDGDDNTEKSIQNESKVYNDIVVSNFVESYRNLTRKMLVALKWVSIYCSHIDFLLKIDEDVFVNVPQLTNELHKRLYGNKGAVYGFINERASVHRSGKWAVSKDEFPLSYYPKYASGNSYVISGNIIRDMFITSEYIPYMPIEDAFITGCLARILGARVVPIPGFTYWNDDTPIPCNFIKNRRISATKVTVPLMEELWKASISFEDICISSNKTNLT